MNPFKARGNVFMDIVANGGGFALPFALHVRQRDGLHPAERPAEPNRTPRHHCLESNVKSHVSEICFASGFMYKTLLIFISFFSLRIYDSIIEDFSISSNRSTDRLYLHASKVAHSRTHVRITAF